MSPVFTAAGPPTAASITRVPAVLLRTPAKAVVPTLAWTVERSTGRSSGSSVSSITPASSQPPAPSGFQIATVRGSGGSGHGSRSRADSVVSSASSAGAAALDGRECETSSSASCGRIGKASVEVSPSAVSISPGLR